MLPGKIITFSHYIQKFISQENSFLYTGTLSEASSGSWHAL